MTLTMPNGFSLPAFVPDDNAGSALSSLPIREEEIIDDKKDSSTLDNSSEEENNNSTDGQNDENEDSSTSENGEEKDSNDEANSDKKEVEQKFDKVPFNKHPRFKQIVNENKELKEEVTSTKTEIQMLREKQKRTNQLLKEYGFPIEEDEDVIETLSEEVQAKRDEQTRLANEQRMELEIEARIEDLKQEGFLVNEDQVQDFLSIAVNIAKGDLDLAYSFYNELKSRGALNSQLNKSTKETQTDKVGSSAVKDIPNQDDIEAAEQRYLQEKRLKEEEAQRKRMKTGESISSRNQNVNGGKSKAPNYAIDPYTGTIDLKRTAAMFGNS